MSRRTHISLLLAVFAAAAPGREGVDLTDYDGFVRSTFPEVHRRLARQIVTDYGLNEGSVLEIAFGAPYLSLELARLTLLDFTVLAHDSSERALAELRIAEAGMTPRFKLVYGRSDALPFVPNTFRLVLARDAMRFWPSKTAAFGEIDRVLSPGGVAFLGGGLGRGWSARDGARFWAKVQDWRNRTNHQPWATSSPYPETLETALNEAGIMAYRVWTEGGYCNCRTWVEWLKDSEASTQATRTVAATPEPPAGQAAPNFTLVSDSGDTLRLSDLAGKVVVLDFWGVDCRACLNMMKQLRPVLSRYDTSGLRVLAINIDTDRTLHEDFRKEKGDLGFEMYYDDAGVSEAYGIRGLPHFVVIDRQGVIRSRVKGSTAQHVQQVHTAVKDLLSER